jgi:hypothetical protein
MQDLVAAWMDDRGPRNLDWCSVERTAEDLQDLIPASMARWKDVKSCVVARV